MSTFESYEDYTSVSLTVNEAARKSLRSLSSLAVVLAILGFASALLNLIAAVLLYYRTRGHYDYFDSTTVLIRILPLLISFVISVLINLFLFAAGAGIRKALDNKQQSDFSRGMRFLRRYYSIYGILFLILIILFTILFLAFLITGT